MEQRVWTISNILSALRIVLVIPITICLVSEFPYHRYYAAGLVLLAIATDFFDGYLARQFHQVSELGKILDPLADKITIGVVAVVLVLLGDVPLWYVIFVIVRDILILVGAYSIKRRKGIVPQSNLPGKIAFTLVAVVFFFCTLKIQELSWLTNGLLWLSVLMMVVSLLFYAQRLFVGRNFYNQ